MGVSLKSTTSTLWIWIVWYRSINAEIAERGLPASRTMSADGCSRVPTALELFFNDVLSRLRRKFARTPPRSADAKTVEWSAEQLEDVLKEIAVELLQCKRLNDVSGFLDRVGALVAKALYDRTTTAEPCGCASERPAVSNGGTAETKSSTVNVENEPPETERPRPEVRKSISFANTGVTTRATYNGNVRDDRKKDAFLKFQTIFTAPSKHREQTSESYDMVFDQNGIMHDKITIDMTTKKKHWSFQKLMNRLNNN